MRQKKPPSQTGDSTTAGAEDKTAEQERRRGPFLHDEEDSLSDKELQIAHWIQKMPDLEPPSSLLTSVMQSLQPKKLHWMKRASLWAKSPKSFTITPLRLVPAAMVLVGIFIVSGYRVFVQEDVGYYAEQAESRVPVVFNVNIPEAHGVSVVGTFNGWKPAGYEMQFNPEKKMWFLTIRLPAGRYEYAFLVDGQRMLPDPEASLYQDDGFGSESSVMILRAKDEKTT